MIKFSTTFILDKEKGKDDCKLRMRVRWANNCVALNVGYRIEPKKWNAESQRCKKNSVHGKKMVSASEINREIQRYEDAVHDVFSLFPHSTPSEEEVRKALRVELGRDSDTPTSPVVTGHFLRIIDGKSKSEWTESTCESYLITIRKMLEWNAAPTFADLDSKGLQSFYEWMLDDGLVNRTINRYVDKIKTLLVEAEREGLPVPSDYRLFKKKLKTMSKTIVWLDWNELHQLMAYEPSDEGYRIVKDMFLFSCFTGLRVSDIRKLRKEDVANDCVSVVQKKTVKPIIINLNKYSREIVDRYMNLSPSPLLFPNIVSESSIFKYTKRVCRDAKIDRLVTTDELIGNKVESVSREKWKCISMHSGRRTFICNALSMGISPNIVMKWTGHSNYDAMKPYIDIADRAKADAMSLFDSR